MCTEYVRITEYGSHWCETTRSAGDFRGIVVGSPEGGRPKLCCREPWSGKCRSLRKRSINYYSVIRITTPYGVVSYAYSPRALTFLAAEAFAQQRTLCAAVDASRCSRVASHAFPSFLCLKTAIFPETSFVFPLDLFTPNSLRARARCNTYKMRPSFLLYCVPWDITIRITFNPCPFRVLMWACRITIAHFLVVSTDACTEESLEAGSR